MADIVRNIAYDDHDLNKLDLYSPRRIKGKHPLLIWIHGGAWRIGDKSQYMRKKYKHFVDNEDYILASLNYPLWQPTEPYQQVEACADAINYLIDNADDLSIDTDSIILVGHSSGAHLTALLVTDELLGVKDKIKGAVCLDCAVYNVPAVMNNATNGGWLYAPFGDDPEKWETSSPVHVGTVADNAELLCIYSKFRAGGKRTVREFSEPNGGIDKGYSRQHSYFNQKLGGRNSYTTFVTDWVSDTLLGARRW